MTRHLITLSCPCCGRSLEVDTRSGKARAHGRRDGGLDDLIDKHRGESERLGGLFEGARDAERSRDTELDDLFRDARDKSKDDKDKPPSPFDLD